jgi:acyl carrier protein
MYQELRVRRVVADTLGLGLEELVREVSLRDDLAADSLDLVELALTLEAKFGITVPDRVLDLVRSYGDLVEATVNLIRGAARPSRSAEQPALYGPCRAVEGRSGGIWARRLAHPDSVETSPGALRGPRRAARVTVAASTEDRPRPCAGSPASASVGSW